MKKLTSIICILCIVLGISMFVGCKEAEEPIEIIPPEEEPVYENQIEYEVIVRTRIPSTDLKIALIKSELELQEFNTIIPSYNTEPRYLCSNPEEYDEEYFAKKAMLGCLYYAGSGAYRYSIVAVQKIDNRIIVTFKQSVSGASGSGSTVVTTDVVYYGMLLAIDKSLIDEGTQLTVNINNYRSMSTDS